MPQLIVNADADIIALQIESWSEIVSYSNKISSEVDKEAANWKEILELAETRDSLVASFFDRGVCREILPHLEDDLNTIKQQHKVIMSLLSERALIKSENEHFLINAKQQIEALRADVD